MHNFFVGVFTLLGFSSVVLVTSAIVDVFEQRITARRLRMLNRFVQLPGHMVSRNITALIRAEVYKRLTMQGELKLTHQHQVVLDHLSRIIYILTKANVRNQVDLFKVLVFQLNQQTTSTVRINVTTNNRVELVIEPGQGEPTLCVRFHSINTLF